MSDVSAIQMKKMEKARPAKKKKPECEMNQIHQNNLVTN